jgi:type I restriction enzyme S subunit
MILSACQRFKSSIPDGWALLPIGKRITLEYGSGLTDAERIPGDYQVFGSNGSVGTHNKYLVEGPGILVGRKGSVGEVHFSEGNFWPIDTVYYVRRKADDDLRFIAYLLQFLRLENLNAATGVPGLTRRDALFMLGAFPTRSEQARIAETLKAADDHIRALEEHIRKAERAKRGLIETGTTIGLNATAKTKTTFRYRYPFPCNTNWEQVELSRLKPQIDYGTNQSSNDYCAGVPLIAIPQVLTSRFAMSELPFAEVPEQEKESLALQPHDVLLVRTNGNPAYIGRSTVIPEGVLETTTIYASYLIRVRVNEKRLRGAFLNYVLQSQTGRRQSNCLANTSAGNFNLGARSLSKLLIPLPKPEEQDEIIEAINAADDLVLGLQEQLMAARRVKQSLLQNLLTGKIRLKL